MQKNFKRKSIFIMLIFSLMIVLHMKCVSKKSDDGEIPITTQSEEALADFLKGQEAMDLGEYLEANTLFENAVKKDSNFAYAYLNIANSAASWEEFKTNMDLASANVDGISEGERILIEINNTYLNNDTEMRLKLANELVEKYPKSQRVWVSLAVIQIERNEHEAARVSLNKAVKLDPRFHLPYSYLGSSYIFYEPKDFSKAITYMQKVVELKPEKDTPHVGLGDAYRANQELDKAREAYTDAAAINPTKAVAFLKKGHINSFLGNFDEARSDYQQALKVAKDQQKATYANYESFTYLYEEDSKSAIQSLQKILDTIEDLGIPKHQLNGARVFTLNNQATIALHHGMFEKANICLKHLNKLMMEQAEVVGTPEIIRNQKANILLWEGLLATHQGDFKAAVNKAEENAKLLEPDNNPRKLEGYHNLMGLIHLKQKKYEKAIEHYKKADLTLIYTKYHLGLAFEGAGNLKKAKEIFKEVATYNFNDVGYALVRNEATNRME